MANGLATYIGYEAVNPTDFSKMQEEFQKSSSFTETKPKTRG